MTMTSIPGSGTSLNVTIPVGPMQAAWSSCSETHSMLRSSSPVISAPRPSLVMPATASTRG